MCTYTPLIRWILAQLARQFPQAIFYKETSESVVALTIDDAPTPDDPEDKSTQTILDTIADFNRGIADPHERVRATFFIITNHLHPDSTILEKIQAEGHEIANHGTADQTAISYTPDEFRQQFLSAHECLVHHIQHPIRWYRPGRGLFNQEMFKVLQEIPGYEPRFPLASMIPIDTFPLTRDPQFTAAYLTQFIFPGAILLLHGGSVERCANTVVALPLILQELHRRSYRVVTLSELWDGEPERKPQ